MHPPTTIMNTTTLAPHASAEGIAWVREWFLQNDFHAQVRDAFQQAGFIVKRVEREECHNLWNVSLRRGSFPLSRVYKEAVRQIRKLLRDECVYVERDAINFVSSGDWVKCFFLWELGEPGVLKC